MEILEFIFDSFEHWLGTAILLTIIFSGIAQIIKAIKKKPKTEKT